MAITLAQMNSAIESTLATATGLTFTQDFDELSEGINDTPLLQVYWEDTNTDPASGTSMTSFAGRVRQTSLTFFGDLYARQRSHMAEDMAALYPLIDAIQVVLEAQDTAPYFGLDGIKALESWSARRIVFEYGGSRYVGGRFIIKLRVF